MLRKNYCARSESYSIAVEEVFKQIPQDVERSLTSRETGLNLETTFTCVYDKFITKFLLNAMLHHVGISWIISSNQEMEYDMTTKRNHLDWLNKGPWHNKNICSILNGIKFEDFITQARTDWYNIMCSLVAHDRLQTDYKDNESSIGDREIPNNETVE